jgi:hypothetical protein
MSSNSLSPLTTEEVVKLKDPSLRFGIDKINFKPDRWISTNELLEHWKNHDINFSFKRIGKDRYPSILCNSVHFRLRSNQTLCSEILTNPSHYKSFETYKNEIVRLIPPSLLSKIVISRIDPFVDIINLLNVRQKTIYKGPKRLKWILEDSFEHSTFYAGNKRYKQYNKKALFKKKGPTENYKHLDFDEINRIEQTLEGKNLPTRLFNKLQIAMTNESFNPFKHVYIMDYKILGERQLHEIKNLKDFNLHNNAIYVKALTEVLGVYQAQKLIQKSETISVRKTIRTLSDFCLGDYYHEGILNFLSGNDVVYNCKHQQWEAL